MDKSVLQKMLFAVACAILGVAAFVTVLEFFFGD